MPLPLHVFITLIAAALLAGATAWGLWWALGQPMLRPDHPNPLTTSEIYNGIKIALTIVGGTGAVIALVVAYRKQRFSEREHVRAEAAAAREDTKLYAERFGRASEQLGSDKAAVRLSGVYAMASLADDWLAGQQMCIDVLCAYLRMPYIPPENIDRPTEPDVGQPESENKWDAQRLRQEEREVRHTIVRVIAAHLSPWAPRSWKGRDFDFTGAVFDGGDFSNAHFSGGRVIFSDAIFCGTKVDFSGVTFDAAVDFSGAKFPGGRVDFTGATFLGGRVSFNRTTISGRLEFRRAEFAASQVSFQGVTLDGGRIDFQHAALRGGNLDFSWAMLSSGKVDFQSASMSGGRVSFTRAKVLDAAINFSWATLSGGAVDFGSADLSGGTINFGSTRFTGSSVSFIGSKFNGTVADLRWPLQWDVPAVFDEWTNGAPTGLFLPSPPHDK